MAIKWPGRPGGMDAYFQDISTPQERGKMYTLARRMPDIIMHPYRGKPRYANAPLHRGGKVYSTPVEVQ